MRTLPGVESAGVIDDVPLDNGGSHQPIAIEGRPVVAMSEQPEVDVRLVSSGYMSAMRIPILRGRTFTAYEPLQFNQIGDVGRTIRYGSAERDVGFRVVIEP